MQEFLDIVFQKHNLTNYQKFFLTGISELYITKGKMPIIYFGARHGETKLLKQILKEMDMYKCKK